jgi:hypothetical protein
MNDRSRPAKAAPETSTTTSTGMVTPSADISVRDVLVAEILALGPEALLAASLGWRLGRLDAEEIAKQKISQAGWDVASDPEWRRTARQPRWVELQRRRGECARKHRLERCTCPSGGAT